MASLKDLLTISAGDPFSKVERGQEEAQAYLGQYKQEKKIIEEINKAIKEAQRKAKKGKGLFGLGGSLLGGLLGILGNVAFPGMGIAGQRLLQGAMGGLASGAAEKYRQEKYDVTGELKELKKKYKGRKQEKALEGTIGNLQKGLKDSIKSGALMSALFSAATPTNIGKGKVDKLWQKPTADLPGGISPSGPQPLGSLNIADLPIASFLDKTQLPFGGKTAFSLGGVGESIIDTILPGMGVGDMLAGLEQGPATQALLGATNILGAPVMQSMEPPWFADPYYEPEFRNPYMSQWHAGRGGF